MVKPKDVIVIGEANIVSKGLNCYQLVRGLFECPPHTYFVSVDRVQNVTLVVHVCDCNKDEPPFVHWQYNQQFLDTIIIEKIRCSLDEQSIYRALLNQEIDPETEWAIIEPVRLETEGTIYDAG